jgi:hypothetical protein
MKINQPYLHTPCAQTTASSKKSKRKHMHSNYLFPLWKKNLPALVQAAIFYNLNRQILSGQSMKAPSTTTACPCYHLLCSKMSCMQGKWACYSNLTHFSTKMDILAWTFPSMQLLARAPLQHAAPSTSCVQWTSKWASYSNLSPSTTKIDILAWAFLNMQLLARAPLQHAAPSTSCVQWTLKVVAGRVIVLSKGWSTS